MIRRILSLIVLLILPAVLAAADWPAWRGPDGQGHCTETNLPLKWSETENVKWKVPLAESGNSTPVIWGEKVFLTQATKGGTVRSLLCLSRADGKMLWQKDVTYPAFKEQAWKPDCYCSASPTTDGERVVVSFGSAGLYCFDFTGKELWKRTDLGKWQHRYGNAASPVLYGDLVIQWCGPNEGKGRNFLLAVNKKTGETVWEHDEKFGSWSTPLIAKVEGKDQLLVGQSLDVKGAEDPETGFLKGFDPKSGKELWFCHGVNSFVYTSPLCANGVAVQMAGFGGSAIAVKLGGAGDITKDRLWQHPRNTQRVGSGVIVGDHVYIVEENGVPRSYELKTGAEVWKVKDRPGGGTTWGSMVHADGRLYVLMRNAKTLVFAASPKYELLEVNSLGAEESTNSSLAISNGDIFIRTFKHLWCIGGGAPRKEVPPVPKPPEKKEAKPADPIAKQPPLKVFVLAGTSNMSGINAKIDKLPDDLRKPLKDVLVWKKGEWVPLEAGTNLVGNEATFGQAMTKHYGEPIGIIWVQVITASGNSPGAFIKSIGKQSEESGRPIVIAGILLDVSYGDASKEEHAKAYHENLPRWIELTRRDTGNPDLPIVMNRAIPPVPNAPYLEQVRKVQDSIKLPAFRVFDCDDVPRGDKVHFTTEGRLEMGRRFASGMIELLKADKK